MGVSRRVDALSEEHQAYFLPSVAKAYRIGPERGSQAELMADEPFSTACQQLLFDKHHRQIVGKGIL